MAKKMSNNGTFYDPVYETFIELSKSARAVTNTRHFRRLSKLSQLAPIEWLYPSANHTRFAHCIGVSHLAKDFFLGLIRNSAGCCDLNVKKYSTIVELAGLCHDIGHGPFSHLFERIITTISPDRTFDHENCSMVLIDDMIQVYGLEKVFLDDCGIQKRDIELIKFLISGQKEEYFAKFPEADRRNEAFLFEIISNDKCGLDVDRWDYLMRDSLYLPVGRKFDCKTLIKSAKIVFKDSESCIGYSLREVNTVLDMFRMREYLYTNFYSAIETNILKQMLSEAIGLASNEPFIFSPKVENIEDVVDNNVLILELTDAKLMNMIEDSQSENPDVIKAKQIIRRINEGNFYKSLGSFEVSRDFDLSKIDGILMKCFQKYSNEISVMDNNFPHYFTNDSNFDKIVFYEKISNLYFAVHRNLDKKYDESVVNNMPENNIMPLNIKFDLNDTNLPYNDSKRIISLIAYNSIMTIEEVNEIMALLITEFAIKNSN